MSLVAYGSSDESADEDDVAPERNENNVDISQIQSRIVLDLPKAKDEANDDSPNNATAEKNQAIPNSANHKLFLSLPKPKTTVPASNDQVEDEVTPIKQFEKSRTKTRAPVKISLPSLSEFKDVDDEEEERKRNRIKPSQKGTGLFTLLPPPKGSSSKATMRSLIPDAVKKAPIPPQRTTLRVARKPVPQKLDAAKSSLNIPNYDSDSDDEETANDGKIVARGKVDFFSLDNDKVEVGLDVLKDVTPVEVTASCYMKADQKTGIVGPAARVPDINGHQRAEDNVISDHAQPAETPNNMLTSNVMNLPKEEILLKNKAEVGPKLPVPEQEYNIDEQGNVAFDEKAIEYLCGKRGVKRKNKDFDEANIIEINGEDIKPDEREWLVKALTEEPAERPVSMERAGPSTQSRKKHQITYLAHQAKAMEVELKNQWAQNRMTRKQTQSKYGF